MAWVIIFQVRVFWMGVFWGGMHQREIFWVGFFHGGDFPRTEYIKCILKCVNTYALLMKFFCKTETLILQINTNLIIQI